MVEDVKKLIIDWKDEMLFNSVNKFPDNFQSIYRQFLVLFQH